jgi:hypothetical protein
MAFFEIDGMSGAHVGKALVSPRVVFGQFRTGFHVTAPTGYERELVAL